MNYSITTLGCKVNQFETQAIEKLLGAHGHKQAQPQEADVLIINTCAVTGESGRKSRQAIRKLKNDNPTAITAVCGCLSQIDPKSIREIGADIVFGSADKLEFVSEIERMAESRQREAVVSIDEPFKRSGFEVLPAGSLDGRTRAYLKIQDGCENFCTYCVIPFSRGKIRSLPLEEATKQTNLLISQGFREIVLTGIEISSYGKDLPGELNLADIIECIAHCSEDVRIRLGSIEPTVITEDFCRRVSALPNLCPHFHLSLQSGCDRTLKRMNRKYDTAKFREITERLRRYFPGCALTADLITGFPGETEEDHAATLDFLREIKFAQVHVFPYSVRPGTAAARMPEQLTHAVKDSRAAEAQRVCNEIRTAYLDSQIGLTHRVLFEISERDGWHGHTENYCETVVNDEIIRGTVKNVKITARNGEKLIGIIT